MLVLMLPGIAWSEKAEKKFPKPLRRAFDPALMDVVNRRPMPQLPDEAYDNAQTCVTHAMQPVQRTPQKLGPCPTKVHRNDTAPFLYGDTYVIHIYIDNPGGTWTTSSSDPFAYTRDSEAASVRAATEWIEYKAPGDLNVTFITSDTDSYYYYNATINHQNVGMASDEYWLTVQVPEIIGFTDDDGDGEVLDDLLEYCRTLKGGGWENVIAVFHLNHTGRSYAIGSVAATVCFTTNSIWGWEVGIYPRTYAHEMLHLYGASDEYKEDGVCKHGDCDDDYENAWIEPVYKNGNCETCGSHPSCIMRWALHNILSGDISICTFTKGHIGWRDKDDDGDRDLEESLPWADLASWPQPHTADPEITASGTAYTPFRWTNISTVEYQIGGGSWKNAAATDGAFNEFEEGFTFTDSLPGDGTYTVKVRAKNAKGLIQNCNMADFTVTLDTTPPAAPYITSDLHPDTSVWYADPKVELRWTEPSDASGIDGYGLVFDQNPNTIPPTTITNGARRAIVEATGSGRWYAHIRAVDNLENWGATKHLLIKIDITPPSVPVITSSTHSQDLYSNKLTATFSWTSTDAHSGVTCYAWSDYLDWDPTGTVSTAFCISDTSTDMDVEAPPDGEYFFHVRAKDSVGNWSDPGHYRIRADRTAPELWVMPWSHPSSKTWYGNNSVTYKWGELGADISGVLGYSYLDTLDYNWVTPDKTADTDQTSVTLSGLASGKHWFGIHGLDNAGNWGSDIGIMWGIARTSVWIDVTDPDTVTNLQTTSHNEAIGQYSCTQSGERTVDVAWTPATDAHSGAAGYAIVWNQDPNTGPDSVQVLDVSETTSTSDPLDDGENWYFHMRTVDSVGNWDDHFATLGPFYIKAVPPPEPLGVDASAGNATITVKWNAVSGVPAVTYNVYRRLEGGTYGSPVASALQDTSHTDDHPTVQNGDMYYYVITAVDSCGIESEFSAEVSAMPEYLTPDTGVNWDLPALVDSSMGGIRGSAPNFTMHGTVTISASDTLEIDPGHKLRSQDETGTKALVIKGTLIAQGTEVSPILLTAQWPASGNWAGVSLENPGSGSILDWCRIRYAVTGITWDGSSPHITNCSVERCSGGGISMSPAPGGICTVDTNTVRWCDGTGIYVFGTPNSTTQVMQNEVTDGGSGIFYDVNPNNPPPTFLTVGENDVLRHDGDGIICGNGAATTNVVNNTVLENQNGIVFNSEGWLIAAPLVQGNNVSGNRNAGIYTSMMASPIVQNNRIVQNGQYGCYSKMNAFPSYTGNTITGSQYGVFVEASPAAVPDFGNPGPGSPGMNRLDGHNIAWMWNNGGLAMNAKNNWWGTAQANPAAVIGGAMPVLWNPVWNVVNQAPVITLTSPNGGTARDSVIITWTDSDPDPADDASINLYYDDNSSGLDGTQIEGASNISEDDEADSLVWDTRLIPAGTYYVYAIISDDALANNSYSPGSVTIQHPDIAVTPDSLFETVEPGSTSTDTITVRNDGTASLSATLHSIASWLVFADSTASVAAGDSTRIEFTWNAASLSDGDYETSIEIESDDHADSLVVVPATLRVEHAEIELSISAIDFGGVPVDSTSEQSLDVRNIGTGDLVVTGVATSLPFSVSGASPPDTVAPGDTLMLTVAYTPKDPAADTDTLTIASSDGDEPTLKVALSGTGLDPEISLGDTAHDYGTVEVGSSSSWSMYVYNQGTSDLLLSSASFDTTGFTLESPQLAASVEPEDSMEIIISFEPFEARDYSATLTLSTNDADESQVDLALSGNGALPEAVLSGIPVDFGGVRAGTTADDSLWVRNEGEDTLTVTGAATSAPFSVVSLSLPAQVVVGDSLQINVQFEPQDNDTAAVDLYVTTDAPTTPTLSTTLTGWGIAPSIAFSDTLIDFGAVHADSSDTLTLAVRNEGNDSLTVTSVTLVSGAHFNFSAPSTPFAVAPGDSGEIDLISLPSPLGSHTDTLQVGSDDPDESTVSIPLAAEAVAPEVSIVLVVTTSGAPIEEELPPGGYDFGAVLIGRKTQRVFRIRNSGGYPLQVENMGVEPSPFVVEDLPDLPTSIDPGDFMALPISYLTDSTVAHAGSLTVVTNDRETPVVVIPLAGRGADAIAGLHPISLGATVFENDTTDVTLHLTNTGEAYYSFIIRVQDSPTAMTPVPLDEIPLKKGLIPALELLHEDAISMESKRSMRTAFSWAKKEDMPPEKIVAQNISEVRITQARRAAMAEASTEWITITDTLGSIPGLDTLGVAVQMGSGAVGAGVHDATLLVLTSDADFDTAWVPVRMRVPRMRFGDHTAAYRATVTDEGAFGFYDKDQGEQYGSGFIYPMGGGGQYLFHGSLWVGRDTLQVSDASYDYDFEVVPGEELDVSGTDPQRSTARFTDTGAPAGLGIEVNQEGLAYPAPEHDDFLILNYIIKNVSDSTLTGVYVGLYLDWDVGNSRDNAGGYDAARATGYIYNASLTDSTHVGIVSLNPPTCSAFHLLHHPTYVYPYGTVRDRDKYVFLSDGVVDSTTWEAEDWSMVMCAGPFDIAPSDTVPVSFAIAAGSNKAALLAHAAAVRDLVLTGTEPEVPQAPRLFLAQSYPNPFNPTARIDFEIPQDALTRLTVYNVHGRLIARLVDRRLPAGRHHVLWDGRNSQGSRVASGVYFYRLTVEGQPGLTRKMVLLK
ncbi:MAG: choice-of-anchor D domain-containing protein [Candidatus Latescibacteria bacterium]|nr:choice-of-anchor D domain-containing protein [Candidatus Latescibacterota bacterium]NIT02224.1 choice-of-anchor D domain-containing protein [Candidatus Latescibacterota bacterium]NIT39109.1 choice-of-anchor D domain-containing protein [Candidatus Latescibacterota bacterium]